MTKTVHRDTAAFRNIEQMQQVIYFIQTTVSFLGDTLMVSSGAKISREQQNTYCELPYVPLSHKVMLVLWSDAVTYPLQDTSPQQVSRQAPPKSHFKCANGRARREETAGSRQAESFSPSWSHADVRSNVCPHLT